MINKSLNKNKNGTHINIPTVLNTYNNVVVNKQDVAYYF